MSMLVLSRERGDRIEGHLVVPDVLCTWCAACRFGDFYRSQILADLAAEKHNRTLHPQVAVA